MFALMISGVLFLSGPHTALTFVPTTRNITQDAIQRATLQHASLNRVTNGQSLLTLLDVNRVSARSLAIAGFHRVTGQSFDLVRVRSVNPDKSVEVDQFAYDPTTHALRYEVSRILKFRPDCHQ